MKRLRHVDVTMTLTSNDVVIGDLPNRGLSFLLPGQRKRVLQTITIVGILTFISMINTTSERIKQETSSFVCILFFLNC